MAWFQPDLSDSLRYAQGLVVLTRRRILSVPAALSEPGARADAVAGNTDNRGECSSWLLTPGTSLRTTQRVGVGVLELVGPTQRIALWRHTAAVALAAGHFVECFQAIAQEPTAGGTAAIPTATQGVTCPTCGRNRSGDPLTCPHCTASHVRRTGSPLFRLLQFAWPRAGMMLLGFVLMLASTAVGLVPIYLTRPLTDGVLKPCLDGFPMRFDLACWYLSGMGGTALAAWLLGWGRTHVLAWVSERISADMRNRTYEHLQHLSLEFYGGKRTGDLISRVGSDTDRINIFLSVNLLDFVTDVLTAIMVATLLVGTDPLLAVATLCPLPLIMWLVHMVRSRLRRGFRLSSAAWGEMTNVLADTIPGIRVVKAFAQEQREIGRFRRANDRVLSVNDRVNTLWSFFGPTIVLLTDLGVLIIWACAVWQISNGRLTLGALMMFLGYSNRFYVRLDSMSRIVAAAQRASASTERIFEILDQVPSVAEPVAPVHVERVRGEIAFCDVGFRYGSRHVVEQLNLTIRAGEMIGLVGHSGAGKSTLVNLLCRFYDVTEGSILVDGVDIRSFPVRQYRRHIGLVLQEPFLFYGTITENIAYGRPEATRREIVAAARAARAHEFILRLPDGYDSLVGERGQTLSGGERQRISIARALLIDPRILILDEATSSVDTETEREIQLALENLIRGRTTVAIAHRLSTLRRADRLVVMEHGRITEVGKHSALIESSGTYARLYHAQLEMAGNGEYPSPEALDESASSRFDL